MANKVCPICGEEYSDTYRKCPFCEESAAIEKGKRLRRGGKRSVKRRSGGGVAGVMLLLAVVLVAGVLTYIFFGDEIAGFMGIRRDDEEQQGGQVDPTGSQQDDPNQQDDQQGGQQDDQQSGQQDGQQSGEPGGQDQPPLVPEPLTLISPEAFTIPAGETGRISVSGGSGEIVWTSSNPEIATVEDGSVTGVAGGTVTITATSGDESISCEVTITGDPWVSSVAYKLNLADFTISNDHPNPVQLKVSPDGYSSISWSVDKPNVATVSSTGKVTRVGRGTATVTCVVDGHVLTCIVRCGGM